MSWSRTPVALLLGLALGLPAAADAGPPSMAPEEWQGPAAVAGDRSGAAHHAGVATRRGAFAVWFDGASAVVAHRAPGADSPWSSPQVLPGSAGAPRSPSPAAPILLAALPSGGVLVLTDGGHPSRTTHSVWQVSPDGDPSPPVTLPFERFTPSMLSVHGARWLVVGTPRGYSGPAFVATREPGGRWQRSEPFPVHRAVNPVTAWVGDDGRVRMLAVAATPHIPDTELRRGAYPMYQAVLRTDGAWAERDLAVRTFGPNAVGAANADGDVSIAYRRETQRSQVWTRIRTLPAGADDWSAATRVPELYPRVDLAVAADGSTVVVRSGGRSGLRLGRLDPDGARDGWQRLAGARAWFQDPTLALAEDGTVVVAALQHGEAADDALERTWRCVPGAACERLGDFAGGASGRPVLASSPDGQVHRWSSAPAGCAGAALCAWWHAAAPGPPG